MLAGIVDKGNPKIGRLQLVKGGGGGGAQPLSRRQVLQLVKGCEVQPLFRRRLRVAEMAGTPAQAPKWSILQWPLQLHLSEFPGPVFPVKGSGQLVFGRGSATPVKRAGVPTREGL